MYRAMALEGLGRDSEAAAGFREILQDPAAADYTAEATYRLAGTELRAGRWAAARDLYGRVLIDHPRARHSCRTPFFSPASASFPLAISPRPRSATVRSSPSTPTLPGSRRATFRLSDIAWRQRRPGALRQLDDFLDRFPGGTYRGSALRLRGDILLEQKKPAEAVAEYSRAVGILADGLEKQSAWYSMGRAQLAAWPGSWRRRIPSPRRGPAPAVLPRSQRKRDSSVPCSWRERENRRRRSKHCGPS